MKKKVLITMFLTLLMALLLPTFLDEQTSANSNVQTIHDSNKPWTITFSDAVATDNQNLQLIYIESTTGQKLNVSIKVSADSKKVIVNPEKGYVFGETYTLVVPKGFKAEDGRVTSVEEKKEFKIDGKIIQHISANDKDLFTHIIVSGSETISEVKVIINNRNSSTLIRNGEQFSKGLLGVGKGDYLTIHAYDSYNNLLETQYYVVK